MKIQKDKQKHIIVGLLISLIIGLINPLLGLLFSIIIGALKETVWDYLFKKGHCELYDFLATIIGGIIGYFINLLYIN